MYIHLESFKKFVLKWQAYLVKLMWWLFCTKNILHTLRNRLDSCFVMGRKKIMLLITLFLVTINIQLLWRWWGRVHQTRGIVPSLRRDMSFVPSLRRDMSLQKCKLDLHVTGCSVFDTAKNVVLVTLIENKITSIT